MCSDHLAPWGVDQGESGYAWSWLGAALASTSFSLGVVTAPGQRYHPVIAAQAIATLEEMFPDRFWVALGSGEAVNEHVTGDPWPPKPVATTGSRHPSTSSATCSPDARSPATARSTCTAPGCGACRPPPAAARRRRHGRDRGVGRGVGRRTRDGRAASRGARAVSCEAYDQAGGRGPRVLQVHVALEDTEERALAVVREQWRHAVISRFAVGHRAARGLRRARGRPDR